MARSSCQKNSTSTWCSARRTARLCSSREESLSSEGGWEGGWEVTRGLYRLLPNSAPPPARAAVIRSAAAPFRPPSAQRPPLVLMSGIVAVISHTDGTCLCVGQLFNNAAFAAYARSSGGGRGGAGLGKPQVERRAMPWKACCGK